MGNGIHFSYADLKSKNRLKNAITKPYFISKLEISLKPITYSLKPIIYYSNKRLIFF